MVLNLYRYEFRQEGSDSVLHKRVRDVNETENFKKKEKPDVMKLIAKTIVKYRYVIFLLFTAAAVYCALSIGKVKVNSDLTSFLPTEAETRRGLTIMEDEFVTYASANVMVSNITYGMAEGIRDNIEDLEHVTGVSFVYRLFIWHLRSGTRSL